MTRPNEILQQCETRGIRLFVVDGELKAAPEHLIDDELILILRQHKPQLIERLKPSANDDDVKQAVARITRKAAEGSNVSPDELAALLDDIDRQAIAAGATEYLPALVEYARGEHRHRESLNAVLKEYVQ